MKVLLVPRYPDTFSSYRHALRLIGKKAVFPPLGLLTVAALLPPHLQKWRFRQKTVIAENAALELDSEGQGTARAAAATF
ncbi:MAG TPA: hypothetical protein VNX25_04285 [Verrucomicrobiae bacterium]|nr:hypothetical protein [Verrucomicrobiae bacterium]